MTQGRDELGGGEGLGNVIPICIKTTKDGTEMTGQNDRGSKLALVCFGKS